MGAGDGASNTSMHRLVFGRLGDRQGPRKLSLHCLHKQGNDSIGMCVILVLLMTAGFAGDSIGR
jgi:hypothetical protein